MAPPETIPADAVRRPAVAGKFYPESQSELQQSIDALMDNAETESLPGQVVALVAPHAGYAYSGPTAASAFKQIIGKQFDTVFVLCPSHRDYFSGVSVYTGKGYETPLGLVSIDRIRTQKLCEHLPGIVHETMLGHREEHAIEVELPFLQRILASGWQLAPLVMATFDTDLCRRLADAIIAVSEGISALIVASSDLYHGYSYDDCHTTDMQTLQAVERFDSEAFLQGLQEETFQDCGGGPITVTMNAARRLGADEVRIIGHTTSGDVTGRHEGYVVGYGAAAFYRREEKEKTDEAFLTVEEKVQLLDIARNAVVEAVDRPYEDIPPSSETIISGRLNDIGGAFVTIRHNGALRGCIGRVQATEALYLTVHQVAQATALQDPRFSPVNPDELEGLSVSISVLGPLKSLETIEDIVIGAHGLYIRSGNASGLLLPQVASSREWDRETFLEQTCEKAGLPPDAWKDTDTEIMYFDAEVFGEKEGED